MPVAKRKKKVARTPVKKRAKRARKQGISKAQKAASYDLEDLLVEMVINGKEKALNGTDIENLIYGTTGGLGLMGYGFGFSVGRALTLKLGPKTPLNTVLDRIGLHDSLYYPLKDKVIITSKLGSSSGLPNMGKGIHLYEAGAISGYLSTSTGVHMNAYEKRCVYNGAGECMFEASPSNQKPEFTGNGIRGTTEAISIALTKNRYHKLKNEYYRVLAYLPLMDTRISEQIMKLMIMVGERVGEIQKGAKPDGLVSNLANYFGAKDASVEKKGIKTIIKLRYESYNSLQAFVAMPAAVITGFAKSAGRASDVRFTTNKDGTYATTITLYKKRI